MWDRLRSDLVHVLQNELGTEVAVKKYTYSNHIHDAAVKYGIVPFSVGSQMVSALQSLEIMTRVKQ